MAENEITIRITAADATGSVLGGLRRELNQLDTTQKQATTSAGTFSTNLGKVSTIAAGFGIGVGLSEIPNLLMRGAEGAAEDAAAMDRLKTAVENADGSWAIYGSTMEGIIEKSQDLAFTDGESASALSLLVSLTGSATEGMSRFALAQDLARGAGIGLEQAARLLGKVSEENTSALSRLGIQLGKNATEMEVLAAVQQKFGGQAETYADSAAGGYARFQIQIEELMEALGAGLLPLFEHMANVLELVNAPLQHLSTVTKFVVEDMNLLYGPLGPLETGLNALGTSIDGVVDGLGNVAGGAADAVGGLLGFGGGADDAARKASDINTELLAGAEAFMVHQQAARLDGQAVLETVADYNEYQQAASFQAEAALAAGLAQIQNARGAEEAAKAIDEATRAAQDNTTAYGDNATASNNVAIAALELQLAEMLAAGATDEETRAVRDQIAALQGNNDVLSAGQSLLDAFTLSLGLNSTQLGITEQDAADLAVATSGLGEKFTDAESAVAFANDALFFFGGKADDVTGKALTLADTLGVTTIPKINEFGDVVLQLPDGKTVTISANDLATLPINEIINKYIPDKTVTVYADMSAAYAAVNQFLNSNPNIYGGAATGRASAPPGLLWVGERGPELMRMKGGETIYTHAQSMAMAGGMAGGTQVIQLVVDGRVLAEVVNGVNDRSARASGLFGR